jgi:hypothetical protein
MSTQKQLLPSDKKVTRTFLTQLIDVIQEDVSSSASRRKYQSFVTGGIGPGVTSSLFQTVYDQDFTLQTANPVFDITFGLAPPDVNVDGIAATTSTAVDDGGKYLYPSSSLMMREKTDIYGQFSQILLGDRGETFKLPVDPTFTTSQTTTDIDAALFVAFKRLFSRDQIKRETFAMKFYQTASYVSTIAGQDTPPAANSSGVTNIYRTSTTGSAIYTDIGSSDSRFFSVGGQYGYLVNAANTSNAVGLIYYDHGIVVLDIEKVTSGSQFISGTISAMNSLGQTVLGGAGTETAYTAKVVPDLLTSGSIDDVIDHFSYARFGSGTQTAFTFQNSTYINSSLIFCNALPDDFNYSSNPTYTEESGDFKGRLTIYDPALPEESQEPFAFITTIGLYDNTGGLVAVAKLSRPVEKNPGRNLSFRVRTDYARKTRFSFTK